MVSAQFTLKMLSQPEIAKKLLNTPIGGRGPQKIVGRSTAVFKNFLLFESLSIVTNNVFNPRFV